MDATQLIGEFRNINPTTQNSPQCPDAIRIGRVETLQSSSGVLYILPHRYITLPQSGGGVTSCQGNSVESPISPESATVLRRDDQTTLDRTDPLIAAFADANERFFLGVELGPRICDLLSVPDGTVSMWMAPENPLSVPFPNANVDILYQPGSKYVYYYTSGTPCVFKGNANEKGVVTFAPSPSQSLTPAPTPSRSQLSSSLSSSQNIQPTFSNSASSVPNGTAGSQPDSGPYVPQPPADISIVPVPGVSESRNKACFPGDASIWVYSKSPGNQKAEPRAMSRLRVGDVIVSGVSDKVDTVFGFTHTISNIWTSMIRLTTYNNRTLVASPGHFLYVRPCGDLRLNRGTWEARIASDVRVGDGLVDAKHGNTEVVMKTDRIMAKGLYNPQTFHGDIVVNGFVVSTFTTSVSSPGTGHALLAPWRALERIPFGAKVGEKFRCATAPKSYGICA